LPDGKKVCGGAILAAAEEPQDSKDWTTEFYHDSRQVVLKLKLLYYCVTEIQKGNIVAH
jgi:hypothetical protein